MQIKTVPGGWAGTAQGEGTHGGDLGMWQAVSAGPQCQKLWSRGAEFHFLFSLFKGSEGPRGAELPLEAQIGGEINFW